MSPHSSNAPVSIASRSALLWFVFVFNTPSIAEPPTRADALVALEKAVAFFRERVAVEGGYVWRYSADLSRREGEGKVGSTTVWVQPPGTPFVGDGFLTAFELTGNESCLAAARDAAQALVRGQLHSGGWTARIEFGDEARRRFAYRVDGEPSRKARDVSSLDDDMTQSALRFLARFDRATGFGDPAIHEAARFGLASLIAAQFPNGAWPQGYRGAPERDRHPVKPASYRESGEYQRIKAYWELYTLNDHLVSDCIETLLLAADVYGESRYRDAALRAGDFLILAQMPKPQPGWAQQYDFEMRPAWARKFEPPAITGGESQSVMAALLDLYEETGERRYLEPLPSALRYFERSLLPDGQLARFYELRTNRPLYFTRKYELTYSDADMPTHYGFKVASRLPAIRKRYEELAGAPWKAKIPQRAAAEAPPAESIREIISAQDNRGAWIEDGRLRFWGKGDPTRQIIDPRTFVRNITLLARFAGRGDARPDSETHGWPSAVEEVRYLSSADDSLQPAMVYVPESTEPMPLLVGLHTWSADYRQTGPTVGGVYAEWCIEKAWAFIHPNFRGPNRRPEAGGSELVVDDIASAVSYMHERTAIDVARVYLVGASGGGHAALLMAGRRPDLWSGVSAWVPIADLAAWHRECTTSGLKYARELELICGGPPGASDAVDLEYRRRSPLTWLAAAKSVALDINAGIRDGHEGSVPVGHSLRAFNAIAAPEDRIDAGAIREIEKTASIPARLGPAPVDASYRDKPPLFRAESGNARVTIFRGGHEILPAAALSWLESQIRTRSPAAQ